MALKKVKLGDLIASYKKKCNIPNLSPEQVSGVNRDKEFFEPSNQVGSDTSNYQEVPLRYFACNLMHVGRDVVLPIAFNHSDRIKYISPAYSVFFIKDASVVLDEYLFMLLKSSEKDRFFWFQTDASVRDGMSWNDFCSAWIELPPIDVQKKYVDIYLAMLANQRAYEQGLDDLKLVCDAYIEDLRRKLPSEEIGKTSFEKMGVSYEEKAFYDILVHVRDTHKFVFEDEKCVDLAKKIKLLVDDKLQYANFFNRDDIKSQLNQDLTVLLYKNGYPPEWDEEVFEKVMEQAENFKRYN